MSALTAPWSVNVAVATRSGRRSPFVGLRSPRGLIGLTLVALVIIPALIVPLFLSWGPLQQSASPLAAAWTSAHLLGTDEVGRDILARVLSAIRLDAVMVLIAIPISALVGTTLGMLGALNPAAGGAAQWVFNVMLGFPGVVGGVVITIALSPGRTAVMVAMIVATIPAFGRQTRVTMLSQISRDYVAAAVVAGTPRHQIVLRHVLPNVIDTIIVRIPLAVSAAIQLEGSLSVVGLGIQPPNASLGAMISTGSEYLTERPMYSMAPVVVVFVAVLGLSLIGDALNEAMLRS